MRDADFVLASASPRRRRLLEDAGWRVEVYPTDIDETPRPGEAAAALVLRLAEAKAAVAAAAGHPLVLAADTEVALDGEVLGKPADAPHAAAMLRRLSGRDHLVLTGVCLAAGPEYRRCAVACTRVWFSPLSEADIAAYVASGEPFGKAGAYAIQGRASRFIPRIDGSYSNVVGLPVALVALMLEACKRNADRDEPGPRRTSAL